MTMEKHESIYDAVHGFIRFNPIERLLIDSEPFQRLHYIHQLGITYLVFPGATHTRFEHSLGTMELATRIFLRITAKQFSLPNADYWLQIIRLAALCHDLGHLPFSHDAEKELLGPIGHEAYTLRVIQSELLQPVWAAMHSRFPGREIVDDVLKMAIGEKKLGEIGHPLLFSPIECVLSQVITGDFFGADRIDYLLRDAQCTGVSYGLFDYHQMLEMLCVVSFEDRLQLGIEENGIASCEALLLARHFMHQRVYQYSSVQAYKFHLARFMQCFYAEADYLSDLSNYLSLTDNEILTALRKAANDPHSLGHSDADSFLKRKKRFKAIALKEGIGESRLSELAIPSDKLFWETRLRKSAHTGLVFPVHTRSGQIIPGAEFSQISIPSNRLQWAYVDPEFEQLVRSAVEK